MHVRLTRRQSKVNRGNSVVNSCLRLAESETTDFQRSTNLLLSSGYSDLAQDSSVKLTSDAITLQRMHVQVNCKSCNLIGEPDFRLTKVLGPRKASMYTRPSFRAGAREGLGTRLPVAKDKLASATGWEIPISAHLDVRETQAWIWLIFRDTD